MKVQVFSILTSLILLPFIGSSQTAECPEFSSNFDMEFPQLLAADVSVVEAEEGEGEFSYNVVFPNGSDFGGMTVESLSDQPNGIGIYTLSNADDVRIKELRIPALHMPTEEGVLFNSISIYIRTNENMAATFTSTIESKGANVAIHHFDLTQPSNIRTTWDSNEDGVLFPTQTTLNFNVNYYQGSNVYVQRIYLNSFGSYFLAQLTGCPEDKCEELDVQLCAPDQDFALGLDETATVSVTDVPNATGQFQVRWDPGEYSPSSSFTFTPTETTTFEVSVIDENGCEGSATHTVNVHDVTYHKEKDHKKCEEKGEKCDHKHKDKIAMTKHDKKGKMKVKKVKLNKVQKGLDKGYTIGYPEMAGIDFSGGACGDGLLKTSPTALAYVESDFEDDAMFVAYPNPTTGPITLEFKEETSGMLTVYDLTGKTVYSIQLDNELFYSVELQNVKKGLYLINLIVEGQEMYTQKLMVN